MSDNELAFDKPLGPPGAETPLDNPVRALTADGRRESFDHIARRFGIDLSDRESEAWRGNASSPPLMFRAFVREPISHARQSPLMSHVPLGCRDLSLRVAD